MNRKEIYDNMQAFVFLSVVICLVAAQDNTQGELCPAGKYLAKDKEPPICTPCPDNQYMDRTNNETSCYPCPKCLIAEICDRMSGKCRCPPGKEYIRIPGGTGFCRRKDTKMTDTSSPVATNVSNSTTPAPNIKPSSETIPTSEKTPSIPRMDYGQRLKRQFILIFFQTSIVLHFPC